ncbi:MAG: hypothetical protein EOO07_14430, partial [Chitinophagaceae bacterium]
MKKLLLLVLLIYPLCALKLRAQIKNNTFEEVINQLQNRSESNPQEKIHVHFNQTNYALGDTVWFKIYVVNSLEHRLSSLSKVVYLDVEQKDGKLNKLVLALNAGMANAQLVLSDSLYTEGIYRLRAYTQWMRNDGEEFFFTQNLTIGNEAIAVQKTNIGPNKKDNTNIEVQALEFFPEGGALVNGLRSKVSFRAIGQNHSAVSVKGYVKDEAGQTVANFESLHDGMGLFALSPQSGKNYSAILANGQQFKLPVALNQGFVLAVNEGQNDNFVVSVNRTASLQHSKTLGILIQANGQVLEAMKLPMNENVLTFNLPKNKLSAGINQLSLFNENNQPIAARRLFIAPKNNVSSLTSDQQSYGNRQRVNLNFDNGLGMVGAYSVAVVKTDETSLAAIEPSAIYTSLLLNPDLKNSIEAKNIVLGDSTKSTALDLLMLCQHLETAKLEGLLNQAPIQLKYPAQNGLHISGKVVTLKGEQAVANAKISLLASKELLFLDTVTNAEGKFSFENLPLVGKVAIVLKASGEKNKPVKIVLDEIDEVKSFEPGHVKNSFATNLTGSPNFPSQSTSGTEQVQATGKIKQGTTLNTVEITTRKRVNISGSSYPAVAPPPDYTFEPDKLQEMVVLEDHLRGLLGIVVKGSEIWGRGPASDRDGNKGFVYKEGKMAILLNGLPVEDLTGISPKALTGVQIVRGSMIAANMATSLMLPEGSTNFGIVFLTMKGVPSKYIKSKPVPGLLRFTLNGYTAAHQFTALSDEHPPQTAVNDTRNT